MKLYRALQELLGELDQLNWDAALFIKQSSWMANPQKAEILYLEGDNELEDIVDIDTHLPKIASDQGMRQLLDVETFRDVVIYERKRNPSATEVEIIHALNYYQEYDVYYDPTL
ncbi:MAG: hypothetical protein FWG14_00440 [Peptococcaceae bacterium]|nr:hypothetical protein [Peptococcaceae bacterium]